MEQKAIELLTALGVENPADDPLFSFLVQTVTAWILNIIHLSEVPEGLYHFGACRIAGQYLQTLKNSGKLVGFDFAAAVKQITEGDTSVTFAIGEGDLTPEQRFDALVAWLCGSGKEQLYRYRRLLW